MPKNEDLVESYLAEIVAFAHSAGEINKDLPDDRGRAEIHMRMVDIISHAEEIRMLCPIREEEDFLGWKCRRAWLEAKSFLRSMLSD